MSSERATSTYGLLKALQKQGLADIQLPNTIETLEQRKLYRLSALYVYEAIRRAKQELYSILGRYQAASLLGEQCSKTLDYLEEAFGTLYQLHDMKRAEGHTLICQGSFLGCNVDKWNSDNVRKYLDEYPGIETDLVLIDEDHPKFVMVWPTQNKSGELT